MFLLFSTLPGGLLSVQYIFLLGKSYPGKYVSSDPQNNCPPLKLTNPVHFEISLYSLFLIPLLYVRLVEKSYHIWFFHKSLCFHNYIEAWKYILLHLLVVQQLTLYSGNRCLNVEDNFLTS